MTNFARVLLCTLLVAPPASADIYKCVGRDKLDLYQNFPCEFDSMGWVAPSAQDLKGLSPTNDAKPELTKPTSSQAMKATKSRSEQNVPARGMTAEQVTAIWGEPTGDPIHGLVAREVTERGVEIWTYGTTRSVQFDPNGRAAVVRH